eukprot:GDKJ01030155.1.p1 GENE.GDKJ01030155.1~~GDKJ01030155.1.p1  ORF type:complete len:361 (+),score=76.75 GDKJ01030155.1:25-1107(+)
MRLIISVSSLLALVLSESCDESKRPRIELLSPAKVNLFLKVHSKTSDGYHDLTSLFTTVDFGDNMIFTRLCGDHFEDILEMQAADYTEVPPAGKKNLIIKALELFREKSKLYPPPYFRVHITKRIPMEAGLGGGSSNAATTLFAANLLSGRPFKESELSVFGAELGSDVPFFFSSGLAMIQGRGEKVFDIVENLPFHEAPVFIYKPSFGQPTAPVFKNFNLSTDTNSQVTASDLMRNVFNPKFAPNFSAGVPLWSHQSAPHSPMSSNWAINDLYPPASRINAKQKQAVELMSHLFPYGGAWMSGSGSTVIGLGDAYSGAEGWEVADALEERMEGGRLWGAKFIRRAPGGRWYERSSEKRV